MVARYRIKVLDARAKSKAVSFPVQNISSLKAAGGAAIAVVFVVKAVTRTTLQTAIEVTALDSHPTIRAM
jgi:hypothetical protein